MFAGLTSRFTLGWHGVHPVGVMGWTFIRLVGRFIRPQGCAYVRGAHITLHPGLAWGSPRWGYGLDVYSPGWTFYSPPGLRLCSRGSHHASPWAGMGSTPVGVLGRTFIRLVGRFVRPQGCAYVRGAHITLHPGLAGSTPLGFGSDVYSAGWTFCSPQGCAYVRGAHIMLHPGLAWGSPRWGFGVGRFIRLVGRFVRPDPSSRRSSLDVTDRAKS